MHTSATRQLSNVRENTTVTRQSEEWVPTPLLLPDKSVVTACGTPLTVVAKDGLLAGADSVLAV